MLNFSKHRKKANLYRNILVSFILTVIIVIIILTSVLYVSFQNIVKAQMSKVSMENLNLWSQNTSFMDSYAKSLTLQIYYDLYISKLILYDKVDYNEQIQALSQLDSYAKISPYVQSIYVYNGINDNFFINSLSASNALQKKDVFYDKEAVNIIENFLSYKIFYPISRSIPPDSLNPYKYGASDVFSFLFYTNINPKGKLVNAIIVNISKEWLRSATEKSKEEDNVNYFILDNGGI